ncbi:hypothetical protein Bbelb_222500 [Branchiostoma belcheri]|nr:hypothetical protein Bbelb_222500 [Branchiostoma belcheri]
MRKPDRGRKMRGSAWRLSSSGPYHRLTDFVFLTSCLVASGSLQQTKFLMEGTLEVCQTFRRKQTSTRLELWQPSLARLPVTVAAPSGSDTLQPTPPYGTETTTQQIK